MVLIDCEVFKEWQTIHWKLHVIRVPDWHVTDQSINENNSPLGYGEKLPGTH